MSKPVYDLLIKNVRVVRPHGNVVHEGDIAIKDGVVQQQNFPDYPMLKLADTPKVETHIVPSERSGSVSMNRSSGWM